MKMFSIGSVIGESIFQDDFGARFSVLDGAVAFDLDEQFDGWRSGITESITIKHRVVWMD